MEGQLWSWIVTFLPESGKISQRFRFDDRAILMVVLWAVLHDRPMNWACQVDNWNPDLCLESLPSPSTISRRWRQPRMPKLLQEAHRQSVLMLGLASRYAAIDAKPLPVGGGSKDPDARAGRAVGHLAKGHKLFAIVASNGAVACYEIGAMADSELTRGRHLLAEAPESLTRIIGDGVYDSVPLHRIAQAHGRKFYTPIRQNRVGRRQQPERLHLLALWQTKVGQRFLATRDDVERSFGLMTNFACGFKGLPNWARRSHRVTRWMWGKILIYHAYLLELKKTRNQKE